MQSRSMTATCKNYSGSSFLGTVREDAINKMSPIDESLSALFSSIDKMIITAQTLQTRLNCVLEPDNPEPVANEESSVPSNVKTKIDLARRSIESVIELQESILERLEL